MKTAIKDKNRWHHYFGASAMNATQWITQVMGSERETETNPFDVVNKLSICGFHHCDHFKKLSDIDKFSDAHQTLKCEIERLAKELDNRIDQFTAVENHYSLLIKDEQKQNNKQRKL